MLLRKCFPLEVASVGVVFLGCPRVLKIWACSESSHGLSSSSLGISCNSFWAKRIRRSGKPWEHLSPSCIRANGLKGSTSLFSECLRKACVIPEVLVLKQRFWWDWVMSWGHGAKLPKVLRQRSGRKRPTVCICEPMEKRKFHVLVFSADILMVGCPIAVMLRPVFSLDCQRLLVLASRVDPCQDSVHPPFLPPTPGCGPWEVAEGFCFVLLPSWLSTRHPWCTRDEAGGLLPRSPFTPHADTLGDSSLQGSCFSACLWKRDLDCQLFWTLFKDVCPVVEDGLGGFPSGQANSVPSAMKHRLSCSLVLSC